MTGEEGVKQLPPEKKPGSLPRFARFIKVPHRWQGTLEAGTALYKGYRNLEEKLLEAKEKPVPQEVVDSYLANKEAIEYIYGKDSIRKNLLYHGTGAMQYSGNKYQEGTQEEFRHPLDAILQNGLQPHLDTWIMGKPDVTSTSFASSWSYAKWYADKHQSPENPLKWEYGNSADWFSFFMMDTILHEMHYTMRHPRTVLPHVSDMAKDTVSYLRTMRKSTDEVPNKRIERLQRWISDIRKGDLENNTTPLSILQAQTDIPGNFGAIVTLPADKIALFDMGPGRVYEERTSQEVLPNTFTSIAVPLVQVEAYKEKVKTMGVVVPVLPIEAIEYHMSRFPLPQVTTALRVK